MNQDNPWHYPVANLLGDILLSSAGLIFAIAMPLALSAANNFLIGLAIILGLAALWLLQRSLRLWATKIDIAGDTFVIANPWRHRRLNLSTLTNVKLRFFGSSKARQKGGGIYHLNLTFAPDEERSTKFYADSRLEGFERLLGGLMEKRGGVYGNWQADAATLSYFEAHGVTVN